MNSLTVTVTANFGFLVRELGENLRVLDIRKASEIALLTGLNTFHLRMDNKKVFCFIHNMKVSG